MRGLVLSTVLLMLSGASAQQAPSDWLIVPGDRVGPITKSTSEAMLESVFGSENVELIDVHVGEGFSEPGTAVYPGDTTRRLEVVWSDVSRTSAKEVRLTGETSRWATAEGISLGSTLKEIERLNGFPFRLVGFAFDYSGTIVDCGRGRLMVVGCSDADGVIQGRRIVLRLRPGPEERAFLEYRQVIGDRIFSSGHPAMQALNPSVYQMVVLLGGGR